MHLAVCRRAVLEVDFVQRDRIKAIHEALRWWFMELPIDQPTQSKQAAPCLRDSTGEGAARAPKRNKFWRRCVWGVAHGPGVPAARKSLCTDSSVTYAIVVNTASSTHTASNTDAYGVYVHHAYHLRNRASRSVSWLCRTGSSSSHVYQLEDDVTYVIISTCYWSRKQHNKQTQRAHAPQSIIPVSGL